MSRTPNTNLYLPSPPTARPSSPPSDRPQSSMDAVLSAIQRALDNQSVRMDSILDRLTNLENGNPRPLYVNDNPPHVAQGPFDVPVSDFAICRHLEPNIRGRRRRGEPNTKDIKLTLPPFAGKIDPPHFHRNLQTRSRNLKQVRHQEVPALYRRDFPSTPENIRVPASQLPSSPCSKSSQVIVDSKEIESPLEVPICPPGSKDVISEEIPAEPPPTPKLHYHITLFPASTFSNKPNVHMNLEKDKEFKIQILGLIMIASDTHHGSSPLAVLVLLASLLADTWKTCVECRALDYKHRQDVPFDPGGWEWIHMKPERLLCSFDPITSHTLQSFQVGSDLRTNPFEEGGNDEDSPSIVSAPSISMTRGQAKRLQEELNTYAQWIADKEIEDGRRQEFEHGVGSMFLTWSLVQVLSVMLYL